MFVAETDSVDYLALVNRDDNSERLFSEYGQSVGFIRCQTGVVLIKPVGRDKVTQLGEKGLWRSVFQDW